MVRIRPAAQDDTAALADLASRSWSDAFGDGVSSPDLTAELEANRSVSYFTGALECQTILVAEADGVLLGYVQFGVVDIPDVDVRPGDQALQRLYVDTAAQGRGVGRRLFDAAMEHPRLAWAGRVFVTVWEQNERAVHLYEDAGFTRAGTTTFTTGSAVMEDLVMMLDRSDQSRAAPARTAPHPPAPGR